MKASPHRAAPCGAQPPGSSMNAIPPFAHLCEPAASLEDGHGRTVRYIRLSVTDRCNLRCTYCRSGMETFIPHESVLRYEEMEQLVDMAMDMGVEKVRLTGGEPFARKGFADFLERLRAAHPALDIRVTTNGTLIGPHIQTLKAIGLNAVNLSLDTFDRDKFEQITGRDLFGKVRENMDALLDAGIPFKLNAVAMRGFNDDELPAFTTTPCATPSTCGSSNSCRWAKARAGRTAVSGRPRISLTPSRGSSPSPPWSRNSATEAPPGSIRFQARTGPASGASA